MLLNFGPNWIKVGFTRPQNVMKLVLPAQMYLSICRFFSAVGVLGRGIFCFALLVYLLTLHMAVQSKINYIGTRSSPTLSCPLTLLPLSPSLTPSFPFSSLSSDPHLIQLGGLGEHSQLPIRVRDGALAVNVIWHTLRSKNVSAGSH